MFSVAAVELRGSDVMTVIHVPRPNQSAMDKNRPVNTLLRVQVEHLHEAEMKLPIGQQTDIYINAIKTEGEAGEYIRRVTEAIQGAHAAAQAKRARPARKRRGMIEIAAVADDRPPRRRTRKSKPAKDSGRT